MVLSNFLDELARTFLEAGSQNAIDRGQAKRDIEHSLLALIRDGVLDSPTAMILARLIERL